MVFQLLFLLTIISLVSGILLSIITVRKKGELRRSSTDIVFTGVCGGLAESLKMSSIFVRVVFILFQPVFLWIYIILVWLLKSKETKNFSNIT
ncbi:PspC domain-containing protein [Lentibacillus jeotgali]|uniref:PspC domain-containing protein n=1 Tax=Lentibacillus jeotgali TaxID=558169 RepID=UPI000A05F34E